MVAYPALFIPEVDDGFSVTFRDLPEANAFGDDLRGTLEAAMYGLAVALEFRIRDNEPWPLPSPAGADERLITLPVLVEAKLALMRRMHETGTTKVELARLLGVSEGAVRRLLRFDHRSHIDRIEAALERLGSRLELRLRRAA
ncbi:MAG TPA: type II toxin-antitoxin system HicB family antitoxin [Geminicoccaceae bacterium]|nr:type II toxin-antitoxin system HicB family antitoxin [Geminicoccaceae bacterium]